MNEEFGQNMWIHYIRWVGLFPGLQNHVGFAVLGGIGGTYLDKKRTEDLATRDAVLRHYVELHPEDFPPIRKLQPPMC